MVNPNVLISSAKHDFNPESRHILQFAEKIPNRLDLVIGKVANILLAETFIEGVDLSHWNWSVGKEPNFKIIFDNGFDFVILKSTQGKWFFDDKFVISTQMASDAGLIVLTYHFFDDNIDGALQAEWCLTKIDAWLNTVGGKTIIFDDVEVNGGATVTWRRANTLSFNKTIVNNGLRSGNYSSKHLWDSLIGNVAWANDYYQWPAHWTPNASPILPVGWTRKDFWQYGIWPTYSWAKTVGTDGNVDVNRFYGTRKELKALLGMTIPPPADCCEELKKELASIHVDIATVNDKLSLTERRVTDIGNEQITVAQRIILINNELKAMKTSLELMEGAQLTTKVRVEKILKLIADVKALL